MSLYRCAICGSKDVERTTKKNGFSHDKAAAVVNGGKEEFFRCGACGRTMTDTLDDATRQRIDTCVSDPSQRNRLGWNSLKMRYVNIEGRNEERTGVFIGAGLDAAVKKTIEQINTEYEQLRKMTPEELDADEKRYLAQKQALDEHLRQQAKQNAEEKSRKAKGEKLAKLQEMLETLESLKKERESIQHEPVVLPNTSVTQMIFAGLLAATVIGAPALGYYLRDQRFYMSWHYWQTGLFVLGFAAFFFAIFCLVMMARARKKGRKAKLYQAALQLRVKQNEEAISELEGKLASAYQETKPKAVAQEDIKSELYSLRNEATTPQLYSVRMRLTNSNELPIAERNTILRAMVWDILTRIFRYYGGEIREKKIIELLTTTVAQGLTEDRFRNESKQKISVMFGNMKGCMTKRVEKAPDGVGLDADMIFRGNYYIYWSMK